MPANKKPPANESPTVSFSSKEKLLGRHFHSNRKYCHPNHVFGILIISDIPKSVMSVVGEFSGKKLSDLSLENLLPVYRLAQKEHSDSVGVLEAFMDREIGE